MRYIYITTNLINGKRYLGQRKTPIGKTPQTDNYLGSGTLLLSAVKKYGKENFSKEIIHFCETQSEADTFEILEINVRSVLKNKSKWYNRATGGQYNRLENHSELTSKYMKEYYSDDYNYTKTIVKQNRKKYFKGQNPIQNTTIAQRDINNLIKQFRVKTLKESKKHKAEINKMIKKSYTNPNASAEYNRNMWANDRENRLELMRIGREKRKVKLDLLGLTHITDKQKTQLSLIKCKASNNMLCVHLLTNGVNDVKSISIRVKRLISRKYKNKNNFIEQINVLTNEINNELGYLMSYNDVYNLIIQSRVNRSLE